MSSDRSNTRYLVTGATGFVGASVALSLAGSGAFVRGMVRNPDHKKAKQLEAAGVDIIQGDITKPETLPGAVAGIDIVIHCAAVLGPAGLDPGIYRAVNADGVSHLMSACQETGLVKRFVFLSTVGVLGPLPPKFRADEGTPPKPVDIYEITKLQGEELVLEASREGFPAVIVRPGWVYGPGDTRTLKLFRMIAKRRFFIIGKALNKQHPIHIDDLVSGIIAAADTPDIDGRVYHLCGPEVITVNDLCGHVAEAAGVEILSLRPPVWLVRWPAWLIGKVFSLWGGDPPLDHRKADFFIINRAYSIRRAAEEMGWKPVIRFKEGITSTIKWYKDQESL